MLRSAHFFIVYYLTNLQSHGIFIGKIRKGFAARDLPLNLAWAMVV